MWELDQLNVEFHPNYKHITEYSTAKMGPKKKGAKKKVGKKTGGSKGPTIIDGVPVSEMSKDQLEGHVRRLQDEVCVDNCIKLKLSTEFSKRSIPRLRKLAAARITQPWN